MSRLIIEGSRRLEGEVKVQGAKNSVLPILASCIMCRDECIIHNCPHISDVDATIKVLNYLGCKTKFEKNTLVVNSKNISKSDIPEFLMREMRSSIIFLGALISTMKSAKLSLPGGCELGPRPIDLHIDGLRQMGMTLYESHGVLKCEAKKGLFGSDISLSFPSVGATENLILASVFAKGTTCITNVAKEPEIIDLIDFLNNCGAKIKYFQGSSIIIEGVKKLHGCEHRIIPDRIVAITYMAAAAVTAGSLVLRNVFHEHINAAIPIFEESGSIIKFSSDKASLKIDAPSRPYCNRIVRTMPYPGFPTDAQAPIMAVSSIADGRSMFVENIFSNRYKHVGELLRLGADIKVEDKVAIVDGVKRLSGAQVRAMDLRAGACLVVAGLSAEGITTVTNLKYLDRGYENIEKNLKNIGASVKRE